MRATPLEKNCAWSHPERAGFVREQLPVPSVPAPDPDPAWVTAAQSESTGLVTPSLFLVATCV